MASEEHDARVGEDGDCEGELERGAGEEKRREEKIPRCARNDTKGMRLVQFERLMKDLKGVRGDA
jgi:hypothetical protein